MIRSSFKQMSLLFCLIWCIALPQTTQAQQFTKDVVLTPGGTFSSWGDYDDDGDPDLFITGGYADGIEYTNIFNNNGGTFTNINAGMLGLYWASGAWGDYDNDNDLDLVVMGDNEETHHTTLYNNNGGVFTEVATGFTPLRMGSAAWADYDNDDDLDLLLIGQRGGHGSSDNVAQLYRNDGGGVFVDINAGLTGARGSAAAWGDYDNDGDLDLLVGGTTDWDQTSATILYNNNAGIFTEVPDNFPDVHGPCLSWGDYDNDGDLDLFLSGLSPAAGGIIARIYQNDAGAFTDINAGLIGVAGGTGSGVWGDYDNDGDLDLVLAGGYENVTKLYRNNDGVFVDTEIPFDGLAVGSAAWGDYDKDADLDILLTGTLGYGYTSFAEIYRNNANHPPSFTKGPDQIILEDAGAQTIAGWATDISPGPPDESGQVLAFLVSNDNNTLFTMQPDVDEATGTLTFTPAPSAHGAATVTIALKDDGGIANGGDDESDPQTFTITITNVIGPVHHFIISAINSPQTAGIPFEGTITAFDAQNDTVTGFTETVDLTTTAGTTTPLVSGVFVNGQWTGNISVNDAGNERTVTATRTAGTETGTSNVFNILSAAFTGVSTAIPGANGGGIAWGDYDNDGDLDVFITSAGVGLTRIYNNAAGSFNNIGAPLLSIYQSSLALGDYDNDGDLDLALAGGESPQTRIYRNDNGSFADIGAALAGVRMCALAWGDYDNDGDLDLALCGAGTGNVLLTKVYRNTGGSFEDINSGLPGIRWGSLAWGDYDNDGDLDLLLAGTALWDANPITRLYRNNEGVFVDANAGLAQLAGCTSLAWGDYDGDGDLDILHAGGTYAGPIHTKIYNNTDGVFTDIGAALPGVYNASVAWGDYDNDGDLDIALVGDRGTGPAGFITAVYRNETGTFSDIFASLTKVSANHASVVWGDYDNDRDLDLLISGWNGSSPTTTLYRNNTPVTNSTPSSPATLASTLDGSSTVSLGWAPSSDAQTSSGGLSYNLRVGMTPGGTELVSPMANTSSGYRRIASIGPVNSNRTRTLRNLSPGSYYWSVQAIDNALAGGPFASEQSFTVVGPVHHFGISTITSPQTAGLPFSITLTAQDINNNTVTDFTGTVDLGTTAGTIVPAVSGDFVDGQRTENIAVTGIGLGKTIRITRTGGTETGTSNTFDMNPGGLHHFVFAAVSSPQTAGILFEVTITALDSLGNLVTTFGGTVDLTTTAGKITPAVSGTFINGQRGEMVRVTQAGSDKLVTATLTGGSQAGISNTFEVIHGALHHYAIGTITSPQTAGVPFDITITAQDSMGNTVMLADTVSLTTTAGTITPNVSLPLESGQTTLGVRVTLADTGRTITARKLTRTCSGTSNTFNVVGGSLHHFAIGAIGSQQISGTAFDITLTAQDEYNNTARSFVETVALSTSAGPIIPVVSGTFADGVRHETVRITGTGRNQTIEATRTGGTEAGMSNGFDLIQTALAGVLANPCFETGKTPWVFYTNGSATFTSDAPGCGTQRKAHVAIATQGTNVQLYQSGIALQPSQLYRLSFRAYSSTGHDLSVSLGKHSTPYTPYGLSDAVFNLTTAWQEFSIEFTTTGFTSPVTDGRLRLWFAPYDANGDHFYIDTVMLAAATTSSPPAITGQPSDQTVIVGQPASFPVTATGSLPLYYQWKRDGLNITGATASTYTIPSVTTGDSGAVFTCVVSNLSGSITSNGALLTVIPIPPNVILNGGFEDGITPWTFYTNGSGNIGRVSPGGSGSAYAGRASIATPGTNVQLCQSNILLEAGMTYKLTFSAMSSNGHDMAVFLHQQISPFTNYGVNNWVVNLTTGWSNYSRVFTTSGFTGTVSDARLRFWFAPYDAAGDKFSIDNVVLEKSPAAKEAVPVEIPLDFALNQNYPNPFNPLTIIDYQLPINSFVSLKVYDLLGREAATLVDGIQEAGFKSVEFDASNLASGVYLYRMRVGDFVDTKKLMVVK